MQSLILALIWRAARHVPEGLDRSSDYTSRMLLSRESRWRSSKWASDDCPISARVRHNLLPPTS